MPLIKEIEMALPFVAELPEKLQRPLALMMSRIVVAHDDSQCETWEGRMRRYGIEPVKKRGRKG